MIDKMIRLKIVFLLVFLLSLGACSKSNIPKEYTLDNSGKNGILIVRLTKTGERQNESAYINILHQNKRFFANLNFVLEKKKHFYAIEMPAGKYTFCDARFHGFSSRNNRCWVNKEFEIKPGEISFMGTLEMNIFSTRTGITWRTNHYQSFDEVIVQGIKKNYPNIDICGIKNSYGYSYANYSDDEKCTS